MHIHTPAHLLSCLFTGLALLSPACADFSDDPTEGDKADGFGDPVFGEMHRGEFSAASANRVSEASIEGDLLTLTVFTGGGCGEHEYQLWWDGSFDEAAKTLDDGDAQSAPSASLAVFDVTSDPCEALLAQRVSFDISDLRFDWALAGNDGERGRMRLDIANNQDAEAPVYDWNLLTPAPLTIGGEEPEFGLSVFEPVMDGDLLRLTVSTSGGCAEHDFSLWWDGSVLESLPPQVVLTAIDGDVFDPCEAIISERIEVDLSPVREAAANSRSEVLVRFSDNPEQSVSYTLSEAL